MLVYDFPLTPKARTYLKFESIFKRMEECRGLTTYPEIMSFLRGVIDYMDLVDGSGALKIDITKDLEKLDGRLRSWSQDPEADQGLITELRTAIQTSYQSLEKFTRQRTVLRDDMIIGSVTPRFLTPCGVNSFDTPLFAFWCSLPVTEKQQQADKWLYELDTIRTPVATILYLWRLCSEYQTRVATKGFMKETVDPCELISIRYPDGVRGYPVVSGFQTSLNVRFLPYVRGAEVGDIEFEIAYIRGGLL